MRTHHIAQANFGRGRWSLEDPRMAGFVEGLDPLNALADASPGFVWRLQTEDGDATGIRFLPDELVIFNMSVWETVEDLSHYVYQSDHIQPLRKRLSWFEPAERPALVLWWTPVGELPDLEEARRRFALLWESGPTPEAFTFHERFQPPAAGEVRA